MCMNFMVVCWQYLRGLRQGLGREEFGSQPV